jgi:ferredoxin--NADP+ reductase
MPRKYEILRKEALTEVTSSVTVYAPLVARKVKAGQFIILRTGEDGERIPLTMAEHDDESVTMIYQKVGKSTMLLDELNVGDCLHDFVGPLGVPTEIEGVKTAAVVGGGLGSAVALPLSKALKENGADVDLICGFRNKGLVILEDKLKAASTTFYLCTDDGTAGYHGFVTAQLEELIKSGKKYDMIYVLGPMVMMKFACIMTKKYGLPTTVSMNPIMIDGTGMCGGCRLTVGGETKFACVDGPDFDGHLVDFDEAIARSAAYSAFEAHEKEEYCNLRGAKKNA